jgi:hypothetical protein
MSGPSPLATRRILLASYHFPPDAAVGGLRIAKFARLLPEFGWEPIVLTASDDLREASLDDSRLRGLERIPIVKTGELPRIVEAAAGARAALTGRRRGNDLPPAANVIAPGGLETVSQKLKRHLISLLALLPDEKKNWSLRAGATAVRLIKQQRIEWVLTSGPPFSTHAIGLMAKAFTGARWIADFRDPWIDMLPERFPHTRSAASDRLERMMESAVVRCADRVVTTTERMRQAMLARYGAVPADRFTCITNSIDADAFHSHAAAAKYDALTITYAGALYFDRTPEPLFRAVGALIGSGAVSRRDIRIKLLGHCRHVDGVETRVIADRYGLGEVVEVIDRVPYSEVIAIMQRSHLLLMLAPERHRLVVPAKIFDYLGSGSSILTIAEEGATADLVAETQCGRCFSAGDDDGIRDYLAGLLRNGAYKELRNDPAAFARYDSRRLTERLVAGMVTTTTSAAERLVART